MPNIYGYSGSEFSGFEDILYQYLVNAYGDYISARNNADRIQIALDIKEAKAKYVSGGLSLDEVREVDESAKRASGYIDFIARVSNEEY